MNRRYVSGLQKSMFLRAFFTSAFTEFTQIIALTIDSIIICACLGEKEIGAVGLSCPFFFLVGIPAACLGNGLQTLCTQDLGRGRIKQVNRRFGETVVFTVLLTAVMTALVFLLIPQMASLFGAHGSAAGLHDLTVSYLRGLGIEIIPFVLLSILAPIVILDNGSRTAMIASIAGGVSNIILDLLAIRYQWGIFGIGLASSLSVMVSLAVLITHFAGKSSLIRFKPVKPVCADLAEIIRLGQPNIAHEAGGMLRSLAMNALVVHLGGGIAISVLSIHSTLVDFVDIIPVGIAGAVSIIGGMAYGEKNLEEIEGTGVLAHRYIIHIATTIFVVFLAFMRPIALIFLQPGSEGLQLLQYAIGCIAVGTGFSALVYSRVNYLQAIEDIQTARHLETGANLVLLLVFSLFLSVSFGTCGVFAAFPAAKIASLLVSYALHARRAKKLHLGVADYLGLDDSFVLSPGDVIAYPVTTLAESALASEHVTLFCKGHHLNRRTAYFAGLYLQEIADNIICHGGQRSGRSPISEIRVTISDDTLIIRIRDNGKAFNMSELAKILAEKETPYENIGIRIICAEAKDISYFRIFGMNMTILRMNCKRSPADDAASV